MAASNSAEARSFKLSLDAFGKQIPKIAKQAQDALVVKALVGVVRKSPVDTGRFRGNWQISTSGDVAPIDRLDGSPRGADPSTLSDELAKVPAIPAFGIVYVANGLPYAQRLEDGHSKQAPLGMVALTLAELEAEVARGAAP